MLSIFTCVMSRVTHSELVLPMDHLKGHSQLVRMCIGDHFSANLHITKSPAKIQK